MIKIGLLKYQNFPWENVIYNAYEEALTSDPNKNFKVNEIFNYPENDDFYDFIIVIGCKVIAKNELDGMRLKKHCNFLFDMGDHHGDPRKGVEDGYLFFCPTLEPLKENHYYLPRFVDENLLFPEKDNNILTLFIDHYNCQNPNEREISVNSINEVFRQVSSSKIQLNIFYQTSKGLEVNPLEPEIPPDNKKQIYKYLPFSEVAEIYRKTHIFLPTHRETLGMVAQEIGACGGITIMQKWMYPEAVHYQFPHFFYSPGKNIDFENIKKYITKKEVIDKFRSHVLGNCGFNNFKTNFINTLLKLSNK